MRIIVLFNLKSGADAKAYEHWARTTDLPHVNALASVEDFRAYRIAGLFGSDTPAPYQYAETIDVPDMDPFVADVTSDAMQRIAAEFQAFADAPLFLLTEQL